jgi:hypothetical protein
MHSTGSGLLNEGLSRYFVFEYVSLVLLCMIPSLIAFKLNPSLDQKVIFESCNWTAFISLSL